MSEQPAENIAGTVARLLSERELLLGTVECGTDGAVAHYLFDTEDGPAVLSDSIRAETIEEVIDLLALPAVQFKSSGAFSAKATRAAAREGRIFLEVDLCLAVSMMPLPAEPAELHETVYVTLDDGQRVTERTLTYQGSSQAMAGWVAEQALAIVQQSLAA